MTKGLMDRSLHHELALKRVLEKAKLAEEELFELKNWKVVTGQKLKLAERDEYESSESHITTDLMMHSVKSRLCIPSLIFHPSTSPSRRLCSYIPICQMIRTSFSQRRCPSPSPLRFRRKKKKPVKPKTPLLLMCRKYLFILFQVF